MQDKHIAHLDQNEKIIPLQGILLFTAILHAGIMV